MQAQLGCSLGADVLLQPVAAAGAGADHESQHTGWHKGIVTMGRAGLALVEHKLRRPLGRAAQRQHGQSQRLAGHSGGIRIHRADGREAQGARLCGPGVQSRQGLRHAFHQPGRFTRGAGQHHAVEHLAIHIPALATLGLQRLHTLPQVYLRAPAFQPVQGHIGQQGAQAVPGNQQVRATAHTKQGIFQHPQEDLRTGFLGGCVEGRHTQRVDHLGPHLGGKTRAQGRHGSARRAHKTRPLPADGGAQQRKFVAPLPAACGADADQCIQRGRGVGAAQAAAIGKLQRQRAAVQRSVGVHPHVAHQLQRGGVGTDQDVLAVVEGEGLALRPGDWHAAGTAPKCAGGLKDGDGVAGLCGLHGSGQTCPTRANDG